MFKDLFKKTVALAAHKSAKFFLSFICIIESIFFPIPPDVMIIPMTLAQKRRWVQIATIATLSSVIGGIIGYAIGYFFTKKLVSIYLNFMDSKDSKALRSRFKSEKVFGLGSFY